MALYIHHRSTPVGPMTIISDGEAITALWWDSTKYVKLDVTDAIEQNLPIFEETDHWLDEYFAGKVPQFSPKVKLEGTPFRKAVWEILTRIPYGKTITYGDIAKEIAQQRGIKTMSSQAVGGAVGHNPVGIIVPCHRVIGADGSLTGYASGLDRKEFLLRLEGIM